MKSLSLITIFALTMSHAYAQDAAAPAKVLTPEQKAQAEQEQKILDAFSNLPKEKRLEYLKLRNEASKLFQEKRIFETFELLSQLEEIFPDDPQVINMRGACYVEIRDFKKARREFLRGQKLTGENFNILFNLAELSFVSKSWKSALNQLDNLLVKGEDIALHTKHLIDFKIYICLIKLAKDESLTAEQRADYAKRAATYVDLHGYLDDTPYFYYVRSAKARSEGDLNEATKWLIKGRTVFSEAPSIMAAWEDTMSESGMVDSFFNENSAEADGTAE